MRREATERTVQARMDQLVANPRHFLDVFEDSKQWSGPSPFFHHRTLVRLEQHGLPSRAVEDPLFLEYLYATLSAWGCHRMGPPSGRLVEFQEFRERLRTCAPQVDSLSLLSIESVDPKEITSALWPLVERLSLRPTEKPYLVPASKTLYHLLPNLVPPIDDKHTLDFFKWKGSTTEPETIFEDVFPRLVYLAKAIKSKTEGYKSKAFRTSLPKTVDNAIVGFMR